MAPFFRKKNREVDMFRILITLLLWKTFDTFVEFWIYLIEKCNHGSQKVRTDQMAIASTTEHVQTWIHGTII